MVSEEDEGEREMGEEEMGGGGETNEEVSGDPATEDGAHEVVGDDVAIM